jgi:hypothetical protein
VADVTLLDEYGSPRVIDESEVGQALAAGWRAETPEEFQSRLDAERYGSAEQQALGGLESFMRGATFGLSDVVSRHAIDAIKGPGAGLADAQAAQGRQRQLGAVGTGLEIAGAVAPALLTGGTGVAGTAARLTPAGASARLGAMAEQIAGRGVARLGVSPTTVIGRAATTGTRMAAGGGVEGALMGAGQAISEEALSGGNYDNLAEKMLAGASRGFLSGAAMGGALGSAAGGAAAIGSKVGTKLYKPLNEFANERAIKAFGAMPGEVKKVLKSGDDRVAELAQEMFRTGILKPGRKADDMIEAAAKHLKKSGEELGAFRTRVYEAIDDSVAKAKTAGYRGSARPLIDVTGEARQALRKIEAEVVTPMTGGLAPASLASRAAKVQAELAPLTARIEAGGEVTMKELVDFRVRLDDILRPPKGKGVMAVLPEHADQLNRARGILEETIGDITDRVATKLDPKMAGKYGALKAQYSKAADINKLAESGAMRDMANRWASPSDYGSGLALAAGLIGGGAPALASLAKGAAFSFAHKLMRERGSSVLAVAAYRAARGDKVLSESIKRYLSAGARRAIAVKAVDQPKREPPKAQDYAKRLQELSRLDPQGMGGIGAAAVEAPNLAAATAGAVVRAKQYLTAEAPTGLTGDDPLQPHLSHPQPNRAELERYARKWEAVDDPIGTVERRLADGTLTREHVEAIKAVYPVTYQEMRQKVFEELADSKERVPYERRVRLGILFDFPADKSMRPDQIARTQALYSVKLPNEQAAQGPAQPAQAPLQLAQSHATPAQAIEGGMNQF